MGEKRFHGVAASPGIAIAPAFLFLRKEIEAESAPAGSPEEELARLRRALEQARREVETLYKEAVDKVGEEQAAIFKAHEMFLSDPTLLQQVESAIQGGKSAHEAWMESIEAQASMLEALNDPVFSARAVDLRDVGNRVVRILAGEEGETALPDSPSVIVAMELTPSQTILLPKDLVQGFCTVHGGRTSHVAILARGLGIPAVVSVPEEFLSEVRTGETIVLDGGNGLVIIDPSEETLSRYRAEMASLAEKRQAAIRSGAKPAVTPDGRRIEIGANLGGAGREEALRALELGAEGVGLLRTEFLYMERSAPPDEEEQIKAYSPYVEVMAGRPIIFRTVDIGGDKPLPYLDLPAESNPFLGKRGIRLSLAYPDLFVTQLRAILRAGAGTTGIKIMFPMVASLEEVRAAKEYLSEARRSLESEGLRYAKDVEVGIMVEVPSAAVLADVLAPEVDFFSIGTNDLSQYTMAADRTHPEVGKMADAFHPAVLRLIKQVVDSAHAAGIWVGICGELAGDSLAAPLLLGLGVDELSMSSPSIPAVKERIRAWKYEDARTLAEKALKLDSPQAVRQLMEAAP